MRPIQLLAAAVLHNLATALRMWVPRLAPRLLISLAICGALHLALSQMGQVTDGTRLTPVASGGRGYRPTFVRLEQRNRRPTRVGG